LPALAGIKILPLSECEAIVNHDFIGRCKDDAPGVPAISRKPMAFGSFGKRAAEVSVPAVEPKVGLAAPSNQVRGRYWGGFCMAYKL